MLEARRVVSTASDGPLACGRTGYGRPDGGYGRPDWAGCCCVNGAVPVVRPVRVDAIVDFTYGVLILISIVLIAVLGTEVGLAFGLGVFASYIVHVVWKMARFDPDWMTQAVRETVEDTVGQTVDRSVGETVEKTVDETIEKTVEETVGEAVEESVGEAVEKSVGEQVEEVKERVESVERSVAGEKTAAVDDDGASQDDGSR